MIMSSINLFDLVKKYNKKTVLFPLTYKFRYGKTYALCGSNGAGKSTLLKILAGVHKEDGGKITGLDRTKTGYMPDNLIIQEGVSAFNWLIFLGRLKNIDKKRVREVLEQTGLWAAAKDDVGTFSKGMYQRLVFSQMILSDPDLILMDEPENCLDPFWVYEWKNWIKTYKSRGKTIIFSSHIINDIFELSDEILFFHEGKLALSGAASDWKTKNIDLGDYFINLGRTG
jgi:ABC-type multidrug transport system ATPase subunit